MIFIGIRVIGLIIMATIAILIIQRSKFVLKHMISILTIILCVTLISLTAMFPLENIFYDFKSAENVFRYTTSGEIKETIYGKESAMIVYSKDTSTIGQYIIPKSEKGYEIPTYFTSNRVSYKFDENGIFRVYNVRSTEDYYVLATINSSRKKGDNIAVIGKDGVKIETEIYISEEGSFLFFYLNDISEDCCLLYNDNKIPIMKQLE